MAHETYTIASLKPVRRWTRAYAITPSDTDSGRNLQVNGVPYRYIQNIGTSGSFVVTWEPDNSSGTASTLYLAQGQVMEGGLWANLRATSLGAGVSIIGMVGREDVGS